MGAQASIAKELADAKKEKKKKKKEKKRKEEKAAAAALAQNPSTVDKEFAKRNSITNYFVHEPGKTINMNDVLGKKPPKSKKYKPKLEIKFNHDGSFKMPIKIGRDKLIKNLGEVSTENKFHNTSNIFPVGYKCLISSLPSLKRPGKTTVYITTIQKGPAGPIFEITCTDDKEFKLTASNSSNVWKQLQKKWLELEDSKDASPKNNDQKENEAPPSTAPIVATSNAIVNATTTSIPVKGKKSPNNSPKSKISGPQKIGLSHPDIKRAIECLPSAIKCTNYKFKYRTNMEPASSSKK